MDDLDQLRADVIERLQFVGANLKSVDATLFSDPIGGESSRSVEAGFAEIDGLAVTERRLHDVAIMALRDLAEAVDDVAVFEAIEEADASWVHSMLLLRAFETVEDETESES